MVDPQMSTKVLMAIAIRNLCDQNIALTERVTSLERNEEIMLRAVDGLTTVVGRLIAANPFFVDSMRDRETENDAYANLVEDEHE